MITAAYINPPIKAILKTFMRIDDRAVSSVPMRGPLILAMNHINWLDAPVGFSYLHPRPLTAFAKVETWNNALMGFLFNTWGAIPINRGTIDTTAFKKGEEALKEGKIIAIAPEGTRSDDGKMNAGFSGIAVLALRTGAPILPFAFYGNEKYKENIRQRRRTNMTLVAGEPFRLKPVTGTPDKQTRQALTDAIMYEIARLLPEDYRGTYANIDPAYRQYLDFIEFHEN